MVQIADRQLSDWAFMQIIRQFSNATLSIKASKKRFLAWGHNKGGHDVSLVEAFLTLELLVALELARLVHPKVVRGRIVRTKLRLRYTRVLVANQVDLSWVYISFFQQQVEGEHGVASQPNTDAGYSTSAVYTEK